MDPRAEPGHATRSLPGLLECVLPPKLPPRNGRGHLSPFPCVVGGHQLLHRPAARFKRIADGGGGNMEDNLGRASAAGTADAARLVDRAAGGIVVHLDHLAGI